MKPRISIIIVHYKAKAELLNCLKSIQKTNSQFSYEIIVVDNSQDRRLKRKLSRGAKNISYIAPAKNIGFGAANNLGAAKAQGTYLFFLNPDTQLETNTLDILACALDRNKNTAIVAPLLLNSRRQPYQLQGTGQLTPLRGMIALSFLNKLFPQNPVSQGYWLCWDKSQAQQVAVVPGTAFMIRASLFKKINGFDQNFFLYFEEADLCLKVQALNKKILIIPEAKVIHHWGRSTARLNKQQRKQIFSQSRFYYFRKHFGLPAAILVQLITSLAFHHLILASILSLAAALRFYRLSKLMMFIGDFGWFYLSARDFLFHGNLPLVGIASSVPVFKQGAIFTWFLALSLKLGHFHPVSGAVATALLNLIAIWFSYITISQFSGRGPAFIASLFLATSPLVVVHSRMPYHTALIFPFSLLLAWSLLAAVAKPSQIKFFLLGLSLAILYQLELASVILIPLSLLFVWLKKRLSIKNLTAIAIGIFLGLTPFIIYDLQTGLFIQTIGFAGWLAVTLWQTLIGLLTYQTGVKINWSLMTSYFSRLILPGSQPLSFILLALSFVLSFKSKYKSAACLTLLWFSLAILAFLTRGAASEAYMPLLFFPVGLAIGLGFNYLKKYLGYGVWILIVLLALWNSFSLLESNYFMPQAYGLPLESRLKVAKFIISQSQDQSYRLVYSGPNDQHLAGDNHYRYLLWWLGNEPQQAGQLSFSLYEPASRFRGNFQQTFMFDNTLIGVNND